MQVSGSPESAMYSEHTVAFEQVDDLLSGWESFIHSLPELPTTTTSSTDPLDIFYHSQVWVAMMYARNMILHNITASSFPSLTTL